ncbi:MAG TPA: hypothetical protein GX692_07645 [Acholeplasmataceae bacterium]|nr:hypothetical protein [Acholeplasmataceae bacterium]
MRRTRNPAVAATAVAPAHIPMISQVLLCGLSVSPGSSGASTENDCWVIVKKLIRKRKRDHEIALIITTLAL